jgi:hypothetical protein
MARAYGSSAHLLVKRETVYRQAASGDYARIPFDRCTLGNEQGSDRRSDAAPGMASLAPLQDAITNEGEIVEPVDPRYHDFWLTGLFGDPTMSLHVLE